jgi:preprotein translocase subunit YajC
MDQLFLPLLLALLFVPLVLSFRKQRRQYSQMQQLQSSIEVGDQVLTTSGMKATVVGITDDDIDLEIAPGVVTTWVRQAIRERVVDGADVADDVTEAEDGVTADKQDRG